jgi:hypothetical protein
VNWFSSSCIAIRVTRLGEFSPNGVVVYFWQFFLITEAARHFELLFFHDISGAYFLTKNGFGYILGHFFTNSSGHPDRRLPTYLPTCLPTYVLFERIHSAVAYT